ncbi:entericidin B [Rhizobium sp. BK529]|uniref:entericidin domain-containing protein n=1 Tax=unclassified Rhizobium TaxID=2613769 RepID=UPI0010484E6F|nr:MULTISPECIES: entericidin A/B family lipoprotein [unclassified Rhizobium]MBB3595896.1 entericidin B [Rhizobium sp. BK529]TCR96280.1 entericidin EcnA/B family protein [Rhizobium sp. BK418]
MKIASAIAVTFLLTLTLSSCGNTIRGMGQDTANTVNATQNAGHRVANAAK